MAYTLQILHLADGEAGLLASDTAPILAAVADRLEDESPTGNSITLAGGDTYIPGPFLAAGTDPAVAAALQELYGPSVSTDVARPDVAIHNEIGVEVSAIGNHEWDLGSAVFASATRETSTWVGADYALVSANLDFSADSAISPLVTTNGQEASAVEGKIADWVTITEGGETIGILGATTQLIENISSPTGTEVEGFPKAGQAGDGAETDDMALLAAQLQPIIDEMRAAGIDKIILQSHLQQLANEQQLATLLEGVDIILAAGSNTRLGDGDPEAEPFPGHAGVFQGPYPIVVDDDVESSTTGERETTLIVNTDNEYTYLGRLVVDFDDNGEIITESLATYADINGAYASTEETLQEVYRTTTLAEAEAIAFADGTRGDRVKTITDAVDAVISAKDGNVLGFTDVYLEGERSQVRTQETNLGNLTADANLYAAQQVDPDVLVSIKNGGGIRAQIGSVDQEGDKNPPVANPEAGKPEGAVSQLDIENSLRFNNALSIVTLTAQELLVVLEHGVRNIGGGQTAQLGGVQISFDPDSPGGDRIESAVITGEDGRILDVLVAGGEIVGDPARLIKVVTLTFLADGGDSYPFPDRIKNGDATPTPDRIDLSEANTPDGAVNLNGDGREQDALAEYLKAFYATEATAYDQADTPASEDDRVQNLNAREDGIFSDAFAGTDDPDNYEGTAGRDFVQGGGGDDRLLLGGGDDIASGGEGDDRIAGDDGDDRIDGGSGDDRLFGEDGADTLMGADGNDELRAGDGDDTASGGAGDDLLRGGDGNDELDGGEGRDLVFGGNGQDRLTGGLGRDQLFGGAGKDIFVIVEDTGFDFVHQFEDGKDLIDVSALGIDSFDELDLGEAGRRESVIEFEDGGMVRIDVAAKLLSQDDFIFA